MTTSGQIEIPLSGNLDDTPLKQILDVFDSTGSIGVVRLGKEGAVWCSEGRLILATSAASPDLADVLFSADVGGLAELHETLQSSSDVGRQLQESHPDSMSTMARLLHEHNLNALFELLVPSSDTYEIEVGAEHALGGAFAEKLGEVVAQAEQRLTIWRQIAARIPSTAVIFKLSPELPEEQPERIVTADEWRYLSRLDGNRTVADLITETGESAFRVCSGLYRLLLEGIIVG